MLFKIVNFVIFAGVLAFFLRRPLKEYLIRRSCEIKDAAESARRAMEKADLESIKITKKLGRVESEIAELRARILDKARQEKEGLLAGARRYSAKLNQDIEAAIANEVVKAKKELMASTLAGAVLAATARIKEEFSEDDHRNMVKKEIKEIGRIL